LTLPLCPEGGKGGENEGAFDVTNDGRVNDDVWVVIPVYDEAQVLESVIRQLLAVFPNVVCVDDGSHDGSSEVVLRTGAHLVRHPVNLGQGAALQTGLCYARAQPGARYFVTFDADGQHRLEDAVAMVEVARSGAVDLVLGTRFAEHPESVPLLKRWVLRTAVLLSPAGRKLKLTDAHNGLRVLTRAVADDLQITMNGMAHASEIVSYLGRSSWRVQEVPVSVRYTQYSRSKGQSLLNGVNILFDLSVRHRGS
jgi:glycosyltransferase involved in cell wall biosynthesis